MLEDAVPDGLALYTAMYLPIGLAIVMFQLQFLLLFVYIGN